MKYYIVIIIALGFSCFAISGETKENSSETLASDECQVLTKGYRDARLEAFNSIRSSYDTCRRSTSSSIYWKARAKCVEEFVTEDGSVPSRCSHVDGANEVDLVHCDIFKPSAEDFVGYLEKIVNEKSIKKCADFGSPE